MRVLLVITFGSVEPTQAKLSGYLSQRLFNTAHTCCRFPCGEGERFCTDLLRFRFANVGIGLVRQHVYAELCATREHTARSEKRRRGYRNEAFQ